jgi:hypothetical protein
MTRKQINIKDPRFTPAFLLLLLFTVCPQPAPAAPVVRPGNKKLTLGWVAVLGAGFMENHTSLQEAKAEFDAPLMGINLTLTAFMPHKERK